MTTLALLVVVWFWVSVVLGAWMLVKRDVNTGKRGYEDDPFLAFEIAPVMGLVAAFVVAVICLVRWAHLTLAGGVA